MNKTKLDMSLEENQIKHMMYQSEKSKAVRLHMEDKTAEAYEAFVQVLKTEKEILGDDHEETLFSRCNMSVMLAQLKRYEEAEKEMRSVIDFYTKAHGDTHQKTRAMKKNLANLLMETERNEDALELLKEVRTFEKYNSLNKDEKVVTLELLGSVYDKLEMWEHSLESFKLLKDMLVNQFGEKHDEVKRVTKQIAKIEDKLDTSED